LGGRQIDRYREEIEDRGLANIVTLERGDGSQYELCLFDELADRASETNRGDFLLLAGSVMKRKHTPEGGHKEIDVVEYEVAEVEEIDDQRATVNRLELGGVITAWNRLTNDVSPVYGLKLLHESTNWRFLVEGRAVVAAQPLAVVGRHVVVQARISAKPVDERNLSGRWRKRLTVTGLKAMGDSPYGPTGSNRR
jgi:hypothetical protein